MAQARRRAAPRRGKLTISERALAEARTGIKRLQRIAAGQRGAARFEPFKPGELHPPAARPSKESGLAMDNAFSGVGEWGQQQLASFGAAREGMVFLGYAELSVLAQRPEYRVVSETLATEMTRKWIRITSRASGADKTKRIAELTDAMTDLRVEDCFRRLVEQDGFFGRSHLYLDTGDTEDADELLKPIGSGKDSISTGKIGKDKPLKALRTVEAVWCYPTQYNSNDPLKSDWYAPSTWFVMGKRVHASRLLTFIAREVPDMLKPAYSFGGLSMSQMLRPYVDNWLRTRQSVADIISSFSVFVLQTDLQQSLQAGGEMLFRRAELFNLLRDNAGLMLLDKESEDFKNVAASLATLDVLQAQTQEHMAAVARIPIVKLLGIQPAGLNSDSEGILRSFYDSTAASQKKLNPALGTVINFIQLSLWGEIDRDITWEWEPLHELNEKEQAEVDKIRAETGDVLIGNGSLDPLEERRRIATDASTRYQGLDVEELPALEEEEEGFIEPRNIRERIDEPGPAKKAA